MIVADNFLSPEEYKIVEKEIKINFPLLEKAIRPTGDYNNFLTVSLDDVYANKKEQQPIFNIFANKIWSEPVLNQTRKIDALAYRLFEKQNSFHTSMKLWVQETDYDWHVDYNEMYDESRWNRLIVSWLWYYKPRDTYTGGELELEGRGLFEPVDNRLILMNAKYRHKMHAVKMKSGYDINSIDGRINLVGTITI